ncbi:MAG: Na+/H+ antiporter [Bacteroidetes bacterium]|nr:Na+/H+ antiporter [Bacteroidota bacterium]
MEERFLLLLFLLLIIIGVIMIAKKIMVAYPVLLVFAGLLISFIPGLPKINLKPEIIFILFLPPILYEAAWYCSLRELYKWRRIIFSFAFVVVFITAFSVAYTAYWFIPGFTLALGFLLGGIISPPDAVSVNAITKFVKLPKRMSTILEGESLLNDATSLIIIQFAVLAITTGKFDVAQASLKFLWMIIGGVGCGILLGFLFTKLHKILPTDANMDVIITFITPYLMYILAEEIHGSGVLAVVAGGLFVSQKRYEFLSSSSRVRGVNVWQSFIFLLNGIVFILIGLDLPQITEGLGDIKLTTAIGYSVIITAAVILIRIISAFGAVGTTLIMRRFINVADPNNPGIKGPLILGWAGMRGAVSLAAALSIPIYLDDGELFPQRNLILFITFVVILLTLTIQGLTLPFLIKKANLPELDYPEHEHKVALDIDKELLKVSLDFLHEIFSEADQKRRKYHNIVTTLKEQLYEEEEVKIDASGGEIYCKLISLQRNYLIQMNKMQSSIDEEIIHKKLMILDYQEERLRLRFNL